MKEYKWTENPYDREDWYREYTEGVENKLNEFKTLYLCEWRPRRLHELFNRMKMYYDTAPGSVFSPECREHYKVFRDWLNDREYTQYEINQVKKEVERCIR